MQGGGGLTKPWGDSAQGFPCCWGTSSEAFAGRHVENIFHEFPDHTGIWVNLYEPATLKWPATGAVIRQDSHYPSSTAYTSKLTIESPGSHGGQFTIMLRVPFWATGANTVTLNGAAVPGVVAGTYLNLTRRWSAGDEVKAYFPATVRWEALVDDRPAWAGVGSLLYGDMLLAGVNTSEENLVDVDPANVESWVSRVPNEDQLRFTVSYTSLCSGKTSITAIPLADVVFETYTVHWHTGASINNSVSYNGTVTSTLSGDASHWDTTGNAAVLPNGPTQNIRTGNPNEVNSATLTTSLIDPSHTIASVSFKYQYVSGYGPAGRHVGANFTVYLVETCAPGADTVPPQPSAVKAIVYQSPELTQYPFDVDPTGYSPWQPVTTTLQPPVSVTTPTRLVFVFYDNDRNLQLNLPMDFVVTWTA